MRKFRIVGALAAMMLPMQGAVAQTATSRMVTAAKGFLSSLGEMNATQRSAAMALVSTALSRRGYEKILQIMEADEVLKKGEANNRLFGKDAQPSDVPAWAFPGSSADSAIADSTRLHRVPNSGARFTLRQAADRFAPPDWHPGGHPPMSEVVAHGRAPILFACAYCHLPNGMGRPENATLAGLPEDYIIAQLAAFRSSARKNPSPGWIPGNSMHTVAMNATNADVASAARYFSALPFKPRVRVIEAARVPRMRQAAFVYARIPGAGTEPIGNRIVEGPPDFERHELRDDDMTYVAYVPPGSIKRGRAIAMTGRTGPATACITCHGKNLVGTGLIPPLAGRYPTYIVRQLLAFKMGTRSTPASQPMQTVVAGLSVADMIAVAAYAASLSPTPHSR